ncbi:DNA polymerase III subunit alpha [Patescibacteria group bacterium]
MPKPQFTHLHVHTHYSLLDGLGKIPDMVQAVKKHGMDSIAITDHGNMYGTIEFYQEAVENDVKPIIGEEMYVTQNSHTQKRPKIDSNPNHITLLAQNETGYKNLIKLTTKAHIDGYYYKPRIDRELLEKYNEGIIALSGCLGGIICDAILHKSEKEAKQELEGLLKIFGEDRLYLEVQHHANEPEQQVANEALFRFSKEYGVKPVATTDLHYIEPEDVDVHDILLCVQTNRTTDEKDRMDLRYLNLSLRSPEQMAEEFQEHPEAIASTQEIKDKCNLEIALNQKLLPHFEVPKKKNIPDYLKELCYQGISQRYDLPEAPEGELPEGTPKEISDRLHYELDVINEMGFDSYFLIIYDFVRYAKDHDIQVGPGRGSAAGSLVSFLLDITNADPIKYNLLFERFLNPERISMPDIDLDFADDRRDEVLRYIEKKYGRDHVAQIVTFGTMAARMAIRDVGRALGLPYAYPDKIAKLIPMFKTLSEAIKEVPELKAFYDNEIDAKRIIDAALKLEGCVRHASIHACGVLISKETLTEYLPLQRGEKNEDTIVTQYSLHPVEDIGLLKVDLLGLKNLTIIDNAIKIIKNTKNDDIDIQNLEFHDDNTYKLFQEGRTTGVFQFESQGMKRYLKQLKPTDIEDLIAMVALYRPGPMDQIPEYIKCKRDPSSITYMHPKLEPILKVTYGVGIYQEQIMQIARDLAGFSMGGADELRKAMAKKIVAMLAELKQKFIQGCVDNDIPEATAQKIFEFIEPFGGYGFNRSHAACYAIVGYQTAFLKANYPAEFMAALLTSDQHDADRVSIEVEETRQSGIQVLPPDINTSFAGFTVISDPDEPEKEAIRFGLSAIKNVGDNVVKEICAERKENGPFKDLSDLVLRVNCKDLNRKSLDSLAKCGALDHLEERQKIIDNMETIIDFMKSVRAKLAGGQTDIFGVLTTEGDGNPTVHLQDTQPASERQRLSWEKELLGLYISAHPMGEHEEILRDKVHPIKHAVDTNTTEDIRICGIITKIQKVWTRNQQAMLFVTLEDRTNSIELLVFPKILDENPDLWEEDRIIIAEGAKSEKDDTPKILVNKARHFSEDYIKQLKKITVSEPAPTAQPQEIKNPSNLVINLTKTHSPENLKNLKHLLAEHNGGDTQIFISVMNGGESPKRIETKFKITYSPDMHEQIEKIAGSGSVSL